MRKIFQISVWVVGLWLTIAAYATQFDEAVSAYNTGGYQTAMRVFKSFAEQGDAEAQYNLELMYNNGHGVVQDYKEATKWYRLAA